MGGSTSQKRHAGRDRLREKRNFEHWAAQATAEVVQKPIEPRTEGAYDGMLEEWDRFAARSRGLASPQDVKTAKKFMKYCCDGRRGRIPSEDNDEDEPRITQDSAYTCWKNFMAAWQRRSGETFSRQLQSTIETLIYGGDNNWLNLRTAKRPARNFTIVDFKASVFQLWANDWYDFRAELNRVNLHLLMLFHVGTSGRSAEYAMNLRYRDTALYLAWIGDRPQSQVVIDLCRNHTKGLANLPRKQPEHLLYELVGAPFYYNSTAFFTCGVLAVNGLRKFKTWHDICAIPKQKDRNLVPLHYQKHILDKPVFPKALFTDGGHGDTATSLVDSLAKLGVRTGFRDRVTPGAIRREALLKVDMHGYSINERMRFADHLNSDTYGSYYQSTLSTVDGQATFFGLPKEGTELQELFRGFSLHRNHNYNPTLPRATLRELDDALTLSSTSRSPSQEPPASTDRQKGYDLKRQHKDRLLKKERLLFFDDWTSVQQEYESDFQQARRLMPQRDRLATTLFKSGSLRDPDGRSVMEDLVTLYSMHNSETYCAALNQSRTSCLACGANRRANDSNWWNHVYSCHKRRAKAENRLIDFCFLCFEWIEGADSLSRHADQHLRALPLKCNLKTFRGNIIRPALCPDCLGDPGLPSTQRMRQFLNVSEWKDHVVEHFAAQNGPFRLQCRQPRCAQLPEFADDSSLIAHRADVHVTPSKTNEMRARFARNRRRRTTAPSEPCAVRKLSHKRTFEFINHTVDAALSAQARPSKRGRCSRRQVQREVPASDNLQDGDQGQGRKVRDRAKTIAEVRLLCEDSACGLEVNRLPPSDADGIQHDLIRTVSLVNEKRQFDFTIEIPPPPQDWWNWPMLFPSRSGSESGNSSEASLKPLVASRESGLKKARRGRPPGSRNKKTVRRERRGKM